MSNVKTLLTPSMLLRIILSCLNRIIFVELDTVLTSKLTQNQSFTQHKIKEPSTKRILLTQYMEYIKLDRDKSTFKSHRDFSSEIETTFKHF